MATIISTKTTGGGGASITGDTSGILQLASADGTTAVTIDASQNVGIGTASPAGKIDVVGADDSQMIFRNATAFIRLRPYVTSYSSSQIAAINAAGSAYTPLAIGGSITSLETGGTERMRIDSSGNVLVGTTTNSFSSTNYGIVLNPNSESFWVANTTTNLIAFNINTNNNIFKFFRSGTQVGAVSVTTTNTTYGTSSDYRLKHDVAPMTGAIAKVAALKPVTYKWNIDDSDGEGFIAHELAEVIPQAVVGEKDAVDDEGKAKYQNIDTSFVVVTLTAAIQEQQAIITTLQTQITALNAKVGI